MLCRLLHDSVASGAWNMAVDESLLATAAAEGLCTLRFYGWEAPTLSLGYFQEYADRAGHPASGRCPCVRRASGGGAILHEREITYSFSVPASSRWAKKHLALYEAVHAALVEVLAARGFAAALCQETDGGHDRGQSFLCFERRAPGDVLAGKIKIGGSAQRRFNGAVVQHGSILLERSAFAPELPGLNDLGCGEFARNDLLTAWMQILVEKLALELQSDSLSLAEKRRAAQLVEEKYGSEDWNRLRGRKTIKI
ncbi:MAG: lipoate--protein ligase family protein [Pirellulales bacterium]|nr:lipoate--protein ligase family protein [Pirellulales bacterium]